MSLRSCRVALRVTDLSSRLGHVDSSTKLCNYHNFIIYFSISTMNPGERKQKSEDGKKGGYCFQVAQTG